ncbi:MAG: DSD1 family PLP-dependent enzyme [Verrucomicrobia bacterium]|nr:DSD1 family PLP-dependent enzyme [Verrucomicrobiota bacterium]
MWPVKLSENFSRDADFVAGLCCCTAVFWHYNMKTPRRSFLAAGLGVSLISVLSPKPQAAAVKTKLPAKGLKKADLPTPALLVDLDLFEANVRFLAEHCKQAGCGFRPHAKTHKCPEIARRQMAAGARGICVATVPEAEAMVAAGISGVHLTSPIVDQNKIGRMIDLARKGRGLMLAVGHAREVALLAEAAEHRGVSLDLLIDIDVGDRRTGILPGQPALELARQIAKCRRLRLRGTQAYSGASTHVRGFAEREKTSRGVLAKAVETRSLLSKEGFDMGILSGGSTGTYNIDAGTLTELQVGSYVFMDVNYRVIGGKNGSETYTDFHPSLTVLTTVVNATHSDQVSVDAGIKAFATDVQEKPEPRSWPGISYRRFGDEFGAITVAPGAKLPQIGDRLEFIVSHCDPTVNLYDRIYATRGDKVEEIWPIAARREFAG